MNNVIKNRIAATASLLMLAVMAIPPAHAVAAGATAALEVVTSVVDVEAVGIAVVTVLTTAFTFKMIRKML